MTKIRSGLSHFERRRFAVLPVDQSGFATGAVAAGKLFQSASKAKQSKVRSLDIIHQESAYLSRFPCDLTERAGLRLAHALRAGQTLRYVRRWRLRGSR